MLEFAYKLYVGNIDNSTWVFIEGLMKQEMWWMKIKDVSFPVRKMECS